MTRRSQTVEVPSRPNTTPRTCTLRVVSSKSDRDASRPAEPSTPSLLDRLGMRVARSILSQIEIGSVQLTLPNGEQLVGGNTISEPHAELHVHDWRFFSRLLTRGDIGFGESYTLGEWSCDHLTRLLRVIICNRRVMTNRWLQNTWFTRPLEYLFHYFSRKNTRGGSRKNIIAHYDLGNDFYAQWLDHTMMYSSAIFEHPEQTLSDAQENKIRILLDKLALRPEHHLLEIGSGWGSVAIAAAKQFGCRVTSITLSDEQLKFARERVAAEGLSDRVEIVLCDYRDVTEKYDRVVSVEMLEAVGAEYLGSYFSKIDDVLKPNGVAVVQVITIADDRYDEYRRSVDWIQRYIFPGGHLPSVGALAHAISSHSALVIEDLDSYAAHYAETLRRWRTTFNERWSSITQLGFAEDFRRMWDYYLCYCEAGFETRGTNVVHLVLRRPAQNMN
ncbi:MAG: class I SAM-dependent methyltransferase [Deltaproteobacteria bacterium]|nr:class I SAM-dependent methyltransferase [Deltaproteobacteria bacterium]